MQVIIMSGNKFVCHLLKLKSPTSMSAQQAELKKHGPGNWLFQTEGSLPYKPLRLNCAASDASYLGNVNELESDHSDNYEEKDIQVSRTIEIKSLTEEIKRKLNSMEDGRSSVSPYDTAWVSFIPDTTNNGSDQRPMFPSCLQWIIDNQLTDGSWGEEIVFCIYDRLLNTLACVVALTLWNTCLHKRNKGVMFIKENLSKLETGKVENMTCGFEFVFPALLKKAQQLDIDIPYDTPVLKDIYARREIKFTRIPKDVIHTIPTTVLFSLEGLRDDLDWQRLLKLQMRDGSFLTSPASTAFAFMETNDQKCLGFLQNVVQKCNGGVPHSYPVDMQARLWAIDRLQRLGISYYFVEEFKELLNHVFRYWNEEIGIFGGRNSNFCDVDDTCMAIRFLRLHGFDVSPANVLNKFKDGDQFFCLRGELNKSPTAMFNLYRCSQVLFPGEKILQEAKIFTYNFLQQCLANNQCLDKWVIAKDIPGEIRYALEFPWYASLPRVESRLYIEQYGGADDIWIGKTLYRMPDVSNNVYLQAAKLDYNRCQSQHRFEWLIMQQWFEKCNFQQFGISKKYLLVSYFLAAASIFEVEKSRERLAWAKSRIISKMITSYYNEEATTWTTRNSLLMEFKDYPSRKNGNETKEIIVVKNLRQFLHQLSEETFEDLGKDIHHQLQSAWETWLMSLREEKDTCQEKAELLVRTINLSGGHMTDEEILVDADYKNLSNVTNKVCRMLNEIQNDKVTDSSKNTNIELEMQALVMLVFGNTASNINQDIKQTLFAVVKNFYYSAHVSEEIINFHISKVLFQQVQ